MAHPRRGCQLPRPEFPESTGQNFLSPHHDRVSSIRFLGLCLAVRSETMRPRSLIGVTALLTVLMCGHIGAQRLSGEMKFLKMNVPGKVERVTWSVQGSECSVQIWGPSFRIGKGDPTSEVQA